ncbi:HD-GYP domain-containing protein [Rhodoferax sp.]|uniref:HD-GYP domain-containing protein n=2 Tax=Rhodoferax sp. TaxID=50421 RepID=UPI0008CD596F|nr:HD domain-containing phosphohydrolase [Rhodoferax sp.]MDO8317623.1 response regulator [Rhodoferax sp.]OGB43815.1 MAG: two-component system response regulator [Burkholderiales bacterium RIFOXYC2_FULL_59_8]OGB56625.1 MAG: two-component system response regulator [Burkholderiales bacterium RIFOXYD12_FULL_59_19]OGB83594.1 MAG: two-component system response regulator [Burkholderiales bacterium RIFOXYD2_FULL_59_8]
MTHQVLIVDDTEINLILFDALVKRIPDSHAVKFSSAVEGLDWAKTRPVDLIILDYMMPEMNGIEFIVQLRKTAGKEDVLILMITANDQKQIRYRALEVGATDFLTKPIDKAEFMARANNLLHLAESRKNLADRASWLAEEVKKATLNILQRERETVIRLSKAAEYRDPETGAHILRMAHYSELIAKGLGLPVEDQVLLLEAAPMHDIGKVGIADNILLKPARLTPDEFEIMKQHAMYGHEILKDSSSKVLQAGAEIAKAHHEKFDGSGYPLGLIGEEIPIFSRIVAVADVFDALTSARPYKTAWSLERAAEYIQAKSGVHFDPRCVNAFFSNWEQVLLIRQRFQDQ